MRVISYYWIHPNDGMPQIDKTERSKESSKEKRRRFYVTDKRRKNMKNSNLFKKFAVMMVSAMMVLTSFAMPTFAEGEAPGSVSVKNVEAGAKVMIYQFVGMETIDGQGEWVSFIQSQTADPGYVVKTSGFSTADKIDENDRGEALIPASLITLASKAAVDGALEGGMQLSDFEADTDDQGNPTGFGTYSGIVDNAGMYVVIVKHDDPNNTSKEVYVYNPMALGVAYKGQNIGIAEVDAAGNLVKDETGNLGGSNVVHAKRTTIPFDKQVTRVDSKDGLGGKMTEEGLAALDQNSTNTENEQTTNDGESKNYRGDTAGRGDVVNFTITSQIPAYADNYKAGTLVFNVYDKLSSGLEFLNNDDYEVAVYVGDTANSKVEASNSTWELVTSGTELGENTFMVKFNSEFIKDNFNKAVVIKYFAKVKDTCVQNFDAETNTASLKYTNAPGETKDEGPITTYHYTFTINGKTQRNNGYENREVVKVGVDNTGAQVFAETSTIAKDKDGWKPLQGATFELYKAADMKNDLSGPADGASAIRTAVSAADGRLMKDAAGTEPGLDRLDAGVYYLIEKTVPSPYKVNSAPVRIVIKAELYQTDVDENTKAGMLKSYKIIVAGKDETGNYPSDLESGIVGGSYTWNHEDQSVTTNVGNPTFYVEKTVAEVKALTDDDKKALKITGENVKVARFSNNAWGAYAAFDATQFTAEQDNEVVRVQCGDIGHGTADEAADIRNTTTGTLPSTGGMGTVAFTVGGIAIMLAALFLLMGGKKKREDN